MVDTETNGTVIRPWLRSSAPFGSYQPPPATVLVVPEMLVVVELARDAEGVGVRHPAKPFGIALMTVCRET
jgi:hypothetical protein